MSTDGQGRPLSDDGQWAWNGTEWVPAAIGGAVEAPIESGVAADPAATVIAMSPFARGGSPEVNQPGTPPAQKDSRKALIISIVAAVIVIAVAAILVVTLSSDKKSAASPTPSSPASAGPAGTYVCTAPGSTDTGKITFHNPGMTYSLSNEAKPGTYAETSMNLTFAGGGLDRATGTYTADAKSVQVIFNSQIITCKQ
jgi:hypothetical protein